MLGSHFEQQGFVQGLGPAHIDHRGIELLGRLQCGVQQSAKRQNGHTLTPPAHLGLGIGQGIQRSSGGHARA